MPDKPTKTFGARLRTLRELQKLNQTDLANRADLTPAAVSQLEADDRLPAFKTLLNLATALDTTVGTLIGEEQQDLPPALKVFFRDLDSMSSEDVTRVKEYAAYLKSQAKVRSK